MRRLPDGLLSMIDSQKVFHDAINKGKSLLEKCALTQKLNSLGFKQVQNRHFIKYHFVLFIQIKIMIE